MDPVSLKLVCANFYCLLTLTSGAIVACYQWAITIGLLLAAIVNNATKNRPNHSSYRIPIAIQFVWASILTTGMIFLTEVC
jgi:MFS transporter, SP family, sugar:H+ symporter